ncbi:MAG: CdvA-like protein, partial [Candidatus Bathyarchaeia archaeon]
TTPNSMVKEVLVSAKGSFHSYPRERIRIDENGEPVLLTEVKIKTDALCDEIPLIWKKCSILESLLKEERILPEVYKEFREQLEKEKERLKSEAEGVLEEIDRMEKICEERFRSLHSSKTNLDIEYAIGKIKEELYQRSAKDIENEIDKVSMEKEDLQRLKSWLSSLLLGENLREKEKKEEPKERELEVSEQKLQGMGEESLIKPKEEPSKDEDLITVRII